MPTKPPDDDLTPEEREAEALLEEYLAHVATLGLTPEDARKLCVLVHDEPDQQFIVTEEMEGKRYLVPGPGLAKLTPEERARLLELTKQHYGDSAGPAKLEDWWDGELRALYVKTRPTPEEQRAEREARGWQDAPTLVEWLERRGITRTDGRTAATFEYLAHRIRGGGSNVLRTKGPVYLAGISAEEIWNPKHVAAILERAEEAERELAAERAKREAAEQALEEERAKRKRPALRQGLGWLRAINQREEHVGKARKRGQTTKRLTSTEAEARRLFRYEPLGWAERLVVHALAALARDEGLLEAHPWALQRRALADASPLRVRLAFPGIAELARVAGYEPDASGRIPKATRRTIERALQELTAQPRWIAEPVLVPVKKRGGRVEMVEDVRVTQTLWVEASSTALTRHTELLLHPVAFASQLASYVAVDNLAARYDAARLAIKRRQMRDEWAAADDYLRYLASVKIGDARAAAVRNGATVEAAAAMVTAADLTVRADVADTTLRGALGVVHLSRDRGETVARKRVGDALAFARAMGTLQTFRLEEGVQEPVWRLDLAYPGLQNGAGVDPSQGLLFVPEPPAEEGL